MSVSISAIHIKNVFVIIRFIQVSVIVHRYARAVVLVTIKLTLLH